MSRRRSNVRQYSAEEQALTDISKEAENRLAAKRAARAEAREIRMKEIERQQKEAEEKERLGSDYGAARSRQQQSVTSSGSQRGSIDSSEGTNDSMTSKDRDLKMELRTLEEKYKAAMMTSAQLDNEKQSLVYQVELFKDQLEELTESLTELQREYKDKNRNLELTKRELQASQLEVKTLREQNDYKDRLIAESGFVIVAAENGELALERSKESPSANGPVGSGGLLLSSESLVLLNKGREGSLGMHSLASSHSATHTTQSASSTDLSQPPSHTRVEEPQSDSLGQTESTGSVTASQESEGSSVDGPMFQRLSKESETDVNSSARDADKVETGVCVEAVNALSDQPGAAISHSPDDRESQKSAQEAGGNASVSSDNTGLMTNLSGEVVEGHVSDVVASHEGMGSESTEESTSDGMFTPLHGKESDSCKDNGRKVSDGADRSEQNSVESSGLDALDQVDSSLDSQSNLPSVVVTECSHSQQEKPQDSEDEDVDEFFDAVSTPLPSPMDTEFEYVETGVGTDGNTAAQVVRAVSPENNEVAGEDSKEVAKENETEVTGEHGKEIAREDGKEIAGEGGTEAVGEDDEKVDGESVNQAPGEAGKEGNEECGEETAGEGSKEVSGEDVKHVAEEDDKELVKGDDNEMIEESDEMTSDEKMLEVDDEETRGDVEGMDSGSGKPEADSKDMGSNPEALGQNDNQIDKDNLPEMDENCEKPSESSGSDGNHENTQADDASNNDTVVLQSTEADGGACISASSDNLMPEKSDDVNEKGNVEEVSVGLDSSVNVGGTGTGSGENTQQESQMPCLEMGAGSEETPGIQCTQGTEERPDVDFHTDDSGYTCKEESAEQEDVKFSSDNKEDERLLASSEVNSAPSSPTDIKQGDVQTSSQNKAEVDENHGRSEPVSELDEVQSRSVCEAEVDHSASIDPQEKLSLEEEGGSDTKSKETVSDQSQTEPAQGDDNSRMDAEDNSKKDSGPESQECQADKEERSEESEEVSDTLSPMLDSRKPVNRKLSEGGTSEDSEAQLNDDEYDFDDIDAVLDHGSPVRSKGNDSEPNVDCDSDDKVSFGSKDSGLQESFANKDKEDSVSFGSRDSGLQESVLIKESETGSGDTVSMQSKDSGAGTEDISSLQSQDNSNDKPEAEVEGAVGGSAEAPHGVAGSRESLDLEAKLDKLVSQESVAKETPSKKKHGNKKSKKFKVFKNIFK